MFNTWQVYIDLFVLTINKDLLDFITISDKKVRLVIISFPGLSTNPSDVYDFVK